MASFRSATSLAVTMTLPPGTASGQVREVVYVLILPGSNLREISGGPSMTSMLSKDSKSGSQFGVTEVMVRRSSVSPLLMLKIGMAVGASYALPTAAEASGVTAAAIAQYEIAFMEPLKLRSQKYWPQGLRPGYLL